MTAGLGMLPAALAYHLHRHRKAVLSIFGLVVVGAAMILALGVTGAGLPSASAPLAAAVCVLPFLIMSGSLAGEARTGRVSLWRGASGSIFAWMLTDWAFRTATLLFAVVTIVLAGGTLLALAGSGWQGFEAVVASLPFMLGLALTLAAPTYGFSALTARHDAVLAALYALPASATITGLIVTSGAEQPAVVWLLLPIDALASLAPGSAIEPAMVPGPHPYARLAAFILAWYLVGFVAGGVRLARPASG
jgi:hypothetical protein